MSAVKFQCPPYKLFEPIIVGVDDRLESPDTLTLRYEEAARAANGGDPRGDSPPRFLEMATYTKAQLPSMHAGYDANRYQDAGYEQYPAQSFPTQQQTDKFAQLNQQSFASNNAAVAQYMAPGPTVLSCQPTTGMFGTKVFIKVSSQYDLFSLSSPMPSWILQFGSERCTSQDVSRDVQDSSGFLYTCSGDAPQFLVTGCPSSSVPLSLILEAPSGEEISRTVVGTFQYLEGSGDDITRSAKIPKHEDAAPAPTVDQPSTSPKAGEPQLPSEAPTNTYEYPTQQGQYANTFAQGNNEMISAYRSTSFTDPHYHRRHHTAGWSPYPSTLGSTGRSPALDPSMGRPSLTPLPMPSSSHSGTPQLIRTSTIASNTAGNSSYHPVSLYSSKAVLKITGKLETMAENWTQEEWENRRRIVLFRKTQRGSTLTASFQPVGVNERPPNSICISCIWWAEKNECYVTSVDTIYLLEQLVAAPNRFSVEEKNRIRRNLEGFHPQTVSKAKAESEEFFKIIMAFPNPKPRNIEKDVKVFPWKILESALKKIIGKYSASPSSTLPPANVMNHTHSPYAPLPTPPGQSHMASAHTDPHTQYSLPQHHDSIPSPRSLSGSQPSWTPYTAAAPGYSTATSRTLSPGLRHGSPQQPQPPLRITTTPLPAVSSTYDTRSGGYGPTGLHTPLSHHPPATTPPRWDPAPATYPESYPSLTSQTAQPVYSAGAYGEPAPRA
ncbi:transcriptional regulator Medusa [Fusarium albosuccineum]|uniref:Transcriptional regulator Medusa n=1 Tax=Fusarium albosuccineum TaxID=1237068 RepID=A0A8H4LP04_9HYPO|nr:transcriptional regulator Medusa [Fusarium albosuccineum]